MKTRSLFHICLSLALALLVIPAFNCSANSKDDPSQPKESIKVLVFSKTAGFEHSSIPAGIAALEKLGKDNNFEVTETRFSNYFRPDTLEKYDVVVFLNTTGDVLKDNEQEAFEKFIQNGGGFVGIHSATDTEYEWPWYGKLVGAYFKSHPKQQEATIHIIDHNHPATRELPNDWTRFDEWYNFKDINPDLKVLAKLDESTYEGGENGDNHPFAWYHEYDGGRAFYTAGGHTNECYQDPMFLKHVLGGIMYAGGVEKIGK